MSLAGEALAALEAETSRLLAAFVEAGAERVSPAVLQPAETLLDLYGEDIRARAFVVRDGLTEAMLRPDFTVPVVQRHMAEGAEPARYCYAGPVWRRQSAGSDRPTEYHQAGFELFDGSDRAAADAEVFSLIAGLMQDLPVSVSTGDTGLLRAVVAGLDTSDARKAALMRHIWRPARFARLVQRFSRPGAAKAELIAAAERGEAAAMIDASGKAVGLRSKAEVLERVARLVDDAGVAPLKDSDVKLMDTVLGLKGSVASAFGVLEGLVAQAPALAPAVTRFGKRVSALAARGVDVEKLAFEGTFGRTTLEYYDGFVFGFFDPTRGDGPSLASGGRYDALTAALGRGRAIPAVGGIIRPELVLALREGVGRC
ncbi:ATP phosphoribosyltransferase regulatory subunit [Algicella marina]|uniref:ATP phosphoribosyltransferase regulatory subunit n=1 Tax=Algicella marina TaxID=2683284 RepID=A0A6P1T2K5_9RHOB|nr:ATP phosphoribosyltransferase regulatory subunit [Algicella marina]QHQ35696.1 ATP phosphoribosyltransferase regulatory subunit [Algicella marina]